jgi:hypothetical protein
MQLEFGFDSRRVTIFPLGAAVAQTTVNRRVPGSNPGGGVRENKVHTCEYLRSSALLRQQKGRQLSKSNHMSTPSTVFIVMRGDTRTGDVLHTMKVFTSHDKALEYAAGVRKEYPDSTSYIAIQETEVIA